MASPSLSSFAFASQQVVIYAGLFIFTAGVIGGPLVLIVFLSLRTFRQSSCAFYLTIMSIVNTLHMFTGLLTYIMLNGFGINWTNMSLFYCKFRPFFVQLCASISFTCMCLAIVDQFLATCSNPRWHQWTNIKIARYIVMGVGIISILHGIPFIKSYNHTISSITGTFSCGITNSIFYKYNYFIFLPVIIGILPVIIIIIFGILGYRNVKQIAYRAVPLVRRELDKQLTVMVLVQGFCDVIFVTPLIIQSVYSLIIGIPSDLDIMIYLNSILNIIFMVYYCHFVVGINQFKT